MPWLNLSKSGYMMKMILVNAVFVPFVLLTKVN